LKDHGFTYDILIHADQLDFIPEFAGRFPDQPFVIDHLAKPPIAAGEWEGWAQGMMKVAAMEHVSCKISGMVTEAGWKTWKKADFRKYMDIVVEAFGPKRIMFGSDWPVCLLAAEYAQVLEICEDYFSSFSTEEKEDFFGGNAIRFYQLNS
jgi:L-fuconolactonase